jgi:flagellum-specific ATP synthase
MNAQSFIERIRSAELVVRSGRITKILPTYMEADGPGLPLGALCSIEPAERGPGGGDLAEVVSVAERSIRLAALDAGVRARPGARVIACANADRVPVGDRFLGRAVDGLGRPIDGKGEIRAEAWAPLQGDSTTPLDRTSPGQPIETGIRAIDALLPLDRGQRIGIFAAAGVGKTSLLNQLAEQVDADRVVISLVGERGREVEALWNGTLGAETRDKCVLVAATSDQTAALRARSCFYAVALAEHWRAQGLNVLLVLDSATRLAMALRELGLAAGEPPTVRAYTPSVFSTIPRLMERLGARQGGGSITGVMTVLSETDEVDDPVSEMMRSILDGHIILSRPLAEQGHYPAIDVPRSISRLAPGLMSRRHAEAAAEAGALLATYEESRTLIETGIYVAGSNPRIDRTLELRPALVSFLRQRSDERTPRRQSILDLAKIVGEQPDAL